MLRLAPVIAVGILAGPVLVGLYDIAATVLGHSPLVTGNGRWLAGFSRLAGEPGIGTSIWLSFWMGPVTAGLSLLIVVLFTAAWSATRPFRWVVALLKPVLAVPHAAAAFGLAFLIMPSGFLLRLVSPGLTGFDRPPDWLIVNDPAGLTLVFGLVLKEIPFLLLVLLAALPQADQRRAWVAMSLGHGRIWSWLVAVFPAVYAQIRLPVYAVVAFATSVVDMAMVLGPLTPPTLSVRILRWMGDPDLEMRAAAAAAALTQLGTTMAALATWWLLERLVARAGRRLASGGHRLCHDHALRPLGLAGVVAAAVIVLSGIALLALSSVAGTWRFPDALPRGFTLDGWAKETPNLTATAITSIIIAVSASLIALVVVLACLENEYRNQKRLTRPAQFVLYLPLLVPQISFLPGLTLFLLFTFGAGAQLGLVIFAHLVFVLPYTYLTLADPWNAFDRRYLDVAGGLGKSRNFALMTIRLPMLLRPILTAFALGFAVSIAQYLPTLLVGAGRHPTLTTEAVALASGGNRRLIGIYALVQTLLPFAVFAASALIPAFVWRNRRALRPGYAA